MTMKLWHHTQPDRAESIMAEGFRDGEFGYNQFTAAGDATFACWGPSRIEVTLDVTDEELLRVGYKKISEDRQRFDEQGGRHVDIEDPADYYRQITYEIPAAYVNAHTKLIRLVPPDEPRQPGTVD